MFPEILQNRSTYFIPLLKHLSNYLSISILIFRSGFSYSSSSHFIILKSIYPKNFFGIPFSVIKFYQMLLFGSQIITHFIFGPRNIAFSMYGTYSYTRSSLRYPFISYFSTSPFCNCIF